MKSFCRSFPIFIYWTVLAIRFVQQSTELSRIIPNYINHKTSYVFRIYIKKIKDLKRYMTK